MNLKPYARFLYANVPGAAAARFAVKDLTASYLTKSEYEGVSGLSIRNGLILDIGANRGQSIAAFKKFAPRSRIIAFEPEPQSVELLEARYRLDKTVTIHGCALGSEEGKVTFFVPTYGYWNCEGMAATDRAAATEWLKDSGRMFCFDKSMLRIREHSVRCHTIDSFELSPLLIKLHAQGAELDILKGAQETIRRHRPALMCAFPSAETHAFLQNSGYSPYVFKGASFRGGAAKPPVTFTWYLTNEQAH